MRETKADVIDGAMNGEKEAQAQLLEEARATVCAVALCRVCLDGKLQAPVCAVSIMRRMPTSTDVSKGAVRQHCSCKLSSHCRRIRTRYWAQRVAHELHQLRG